MARSKTAENALLQYEAGQSLSAMAALTDSGDHSTFTSGDKYWSDESGSEPDVRPDGLVTGGEITAASSGTNDAVDVAALTCYLAGVLTSVSASTDFSITRPSGDSIAAGTGDHKISSVTVSSGGTLTEVEGNEGASFSSTRGEDGGPPYIPVGSIEIGQIRMDSETSAVITSSEIKQQQGLSQERYDYPGWSINYRLGKVVFDIALKAIHTADVAKKVYAEYYTAEWAECPKAYDWVPPKNTHSVNSTQVYGGTSNTISTSTGAGSFSAELNNGINDGILNREDKNTWFRFYPDRNTTSKFQVVHAKVGIAYSYPAGGAMNASFTLSPLDEKAENLTS